MYADHDSFLYLFCQNHDIKLYTSNTSSKGGIILLVIIIVETVVIKPPFTCISFLLNNNFRIKVINVVFMKADIVVFTVKDI